MTLAGIIIDIDGTLVDTNHHHATAWQRAFEENGFRIGNDRIRAEVGRGTETIVEALLGAEAERVLGRAIRAARAAHFEREIMRAPRHDTHPRARELLAELRKRGYAIAATTTATRPELSAVERMFRLPLRELASQVMTAGDDARAPLPNPVPRALSALGLGAPECVLIGDSPEDGVRAHIAGLSFIGLASGGHDEDALASAGARLVFRNTAALLERLDDALQAASPQSVILDRARLDALMQRALRDAELALTRGELPIGAILARGDGSVIASGHDETKSRGNKTAHAEMVVFNESSGQMSPADGDLILVCNLEPCVMCLGAAIQTSVDVVVFGMHEPADNASRCVRPPSRPTAKMPRLVGGVLEASSRALFERWMHTHAGSGDPYEGYVERLLGKKKG